MSRPPLNPEAFRQAIRATLPSNPALTPVALITAPFGSISPSIQLGLLKAILAGRGIAATVYYLNLPFASLIGYDEYNMLAAVRNIQLGEWIFSQATFGPSTSDEIFLRSFPSISGVLEELHWKNQRLLALKREVAPAYVEACVDVIPWDSHSIIGFTSTFQQNVASLAISRLVKERFPQVKIVFGGANFDDEMGAEYTRAFPWIDYSIVGEGDEILPDLVEELLRGREVRPRAGLAMRSAKRFTFCGLAHPVVDLASSPPPDYDEFFETAERLRLFSEWKRAKHIRLPFESSRGCWWGARSHCTFCGLNANGMKFRAKAAGQVLKELAHLSSRYGWTKFEAVDNIMDRGFLDDLCGVLAANKQDLDIFYEVKANMSRTDIQKLRHAGIRYIQPGVESMSSHMLDLMRKGVRAIHNVELLKWARYYGLRVSWNVLVGVPGERVEDVIQQLDWIKSIEHLPPPHAVTRIWIERFSPYYSQRGLYPIKDLRPERSYSFVYPPGTVNLARTAYFFDCQMGDTLPENAWEPVDRAVAEWQASWESTGSAPSLTYKRAFDTIFISDNRPHGERKVHKYSGLIANLYRFCEVRRTVGECTRHVFGDGSGEPDQVEEAIDHLLQRRFIIRENDTILSLALPENYQW